MASSDVIRADFARCSGTASDRLEPSVQRLVAEVPLRARVLEIGCGTGMLARELATKRGAKVTAIDLSPRMIDVARVRTPGSLAIEYRVADFLSLSPCGFDVVVAVNTLHHLPLHGGALRMAAALVPGGKLLIADLFSAAGVFELPYTGLSWLTRGSRPVDSHHDHIAALATVRQELRAALPGVRVRRHLGWRYTAIWHRAQAAAHFAALR